MSGEKYLRPKELRELLKVSEKTLYNWERDGKIKSVKTKGGQRRYLKSDFISEEEEIRKETERTKRKICYCRVSTRSQKEDLERQVEFFRRKFPDHEIIKDFGSGLNSKRKGFNSILDSGIKGELEEVVVTHKDRFTRFNFEIFERILRDYSNAKILVLNETELSPEEEVIKDLLSIITVFSSRVYGLRSNSIKREIRKQTLSNSES